MSDEVKDGGPAFPLQLLGPEFASGCSGMTLRDWFAGQALVGVMTGAEGLGHLTDDDLSRMASQVARLLYSVSDAMLAEREKRQ